MNSRRSLIKQVFGPGTEFDTKYLNAPNTGDQKKSLSLLLEKRRFYFQQLLQNIVVCTFRFLLLFKLSIGAKSLQTKFVT